MAVKEQEQRRPAGVDEAMAGRLLEQLRRGNLVLADLGGMAAKGHREAAAALWDHFAARWAARDEQPQRGANARLGAGRAA